MRLGEDDLPECIAEASHLHAERPRERRRRNAGRCATERDETAQYHADQRMHRVAAGCAADPRQLGRVLA